MRQFLCVLKYSYMEGLRKKAFILTTIVGVIIFALLINFPNIYNNLTSNEKEKIIILDPAGLVISNGDSLKQLSSKYEWIMGDSNKEEVRQKLIDGELDGAVFVKKGNDNAPQIEYLVKRSNPQGEDDINKEIQRQYTFNLLNSLTLSSGDKDKIISKIGFEVKELAKSTKENFFAVYFMIMILYATILLYGTTITTSVASEKSSRVMEVLITSVKPVWLLFGKTIGYGLLGLSQFLLFIISACFTYVYSPKQILKLGDMNFTFSTITLSTLVYLVVFFILGYFLYATLHAAAGSLVSRSEDAASTMIPLSMLIMISFLLSMLSIGNPDTMLVKVCSFIPFTSPMLMLIRIALTDVPVIQIMISIVILLISILLGGLLSAKIYQVGVLINGKVPSVKEIWLVAKNNKLKM